MPRARRSGLAPRWERRGPSLSTPYRWHGTRQTTRSVAFAGTLFAVLFIPDPASAQTGGSAPQPRGAAQAAIDAADAANVLRTVKQEFDDYKKEHGGIPEDQIATKNLTTDPRTPFDYYIRGTLDYAGGHFDRAIADLNRAVQMHLRTFGLFTTLGYSYVAVDRLQQAMSSFSEAIRIKPDAAPTIALRERIAALIQQKGSQGRQASFEAWSCEDGSRLRIDPRHRTVQILESAGPLHRTETLVDGAVGPITSRAVCNFPGWPVEPEQILFRQSVRYDGRILRWDVTVVGPPMYTYLGATMNFATSLDLRTGRGLGNGKVAHCSKVSTQ